VREKVSFDSGEAGSASSVQQVTAPPVASSQTGSEAPADHAVSTEPVGNDEPAPRRAGWWSRRFGGGQ